MKNDTNSKLIERTRLFRLVSIWEEVADLIDDRGWSQSDFATIMGLSDSAISGLIRGKYNLTADLARKFAAIFDKSENYWIDRETEYMYMYQTNKTEELRKVANLAQLHTVFPVGKLYRCGLIESNDNPEQIESDLSEILGMDDFNRACTEYVDFASDQQRSMHFRDSLFLLIWFKALKAKIISNNVALDKYDIGKAQALLTHMTDDSRTLLEIEYLLPELVNAGIGCFIDLGAGRSYQCVLFGMCRHPIIVIPFGYIDSIRKHVIEALTFITRHADTLPSEAPAVKTSNVIIPPLTIPVSQTFVSVPITRTSDMYHSINAENDGVSKNLIERPEHYVWKTISDPINTPRRQTLSEYVSKQNRGDLSGLFSLYGLALNKKNVEDIRDLI